ERTAVRRPIRVHDLRATFITLALANGRSESWVADRTGHKSSQMINGYRRAARSVAELGLGGLLDLDQALPELRPMVPGPAPSEAGSGREAATHPPNEAAESETPVGKPNGSSLVHEEGLEPSSLSAPEPKPGAYASSATRAMTRAYTGAGYAPPPAR